MSVVVVRWLFNFQIYDQAVSTAWIMALVDVPRTRNLALRHAFNKPSNYMGQSGQVRMRHEERANWWFILVPGITHTVL